MFEREVSSDKDSDASVRRGSSVIGVFISGPSDVAPFKTVVRDSAYRWSKLHGPSYQAVLLPLMWETDSTPLMGDSAQGVINRQLVDDCDSMIAVFCARLGTTTPTAESGTVEEIEQFLKAGKPVSVLFYNGTAPLPQIDTDQLNRLREYKQQCESNGLLGQFDSPESLSEQAERILLRHVQQILGKEEQSVAEAPPRGALAADVADKVVTAGQTVEGQPSANAFSKLGRGEIDEGMRLLRETFDKEKPDDSWEEAEALGLSYAHVVGGSDRAFGMLRERFAANSAPTAEIKFIFGRSLEAKGELEEALRYLHEAATSKDEWGDVAFTRILQIELTRGHKSQALRELSDRLTRETERRKKAEWIRSFARVLRKSDSAEEQHEGLELLELAHEFQPHDDEEQSVLARVYTDMGDAFGFAVYHYAEVLAREPTPEVETNYGWNASKLGLPIVAVRHYRTAEARDEPYAVANLALTLLDAGFADDARALLEKARKRGLSHPQMDKATGSIVEHEEDETSRLEERLKVVKTVRQWRVQEGQAFVDPRPESSEVSGAYNSTPDFAESFLSMTPLGGITGTFQFEPGMLGSMRGIMQGRLISFSWESVPPPPPPKPADSGKLNIAGLLALAPYPTTGFGALVWQDDGSMRGYFARGTAPLSENNADQLTEWRLTRDTARTEQLRSLGRKLAALATSKAGPVLSP